MVARQDIAVRRKRAMVACLSVMQRMKAPSRLHLMIDRESCTTSCYPWIDIYLSNDWVMGPEPEPEPED